MFPIFVAITKFFLCKATTGLWYDIVDLVYKMEQDFSRIYKAIFSFIAGFAKPRIRRAVPHAKAAFVVARLNLEEAATNIFRETSSKIPIAIDQKLNGQEGRGSNKKGNCAEKESTPSVFKELRQKIPGFFQAL